MAKSLFLQHFQKNLATCIKEILSDWGYQNLIVSVEENNICGAFNGFLDICITNETNETSVIAIEIEHISDFGQAIRNIEKMKEWAHRSNYRKCGFLHIFNEYCSISEDSICELISYARTNERKDLGFIYEFIFYSINDKKETKKTAEHLVLSKDFKARLRMLMKDSEIV
jgi:hypothetical protein